MNISKALFPSGGWGDLSSSLHTVGNGLSISGLVLFSKQCCPCPRRNPSFENTELEVWQSQEPVA